MSEAALFVSRIADLERLAGRVLAGGWRGLRLDGGFRTAHESAAYERLLQVAGRVLDKRPLARLYFGHESCEHLLPAAALWTRAADLAADLGLGLTAVLPPTYASREEQVAEVLEHLAALAERRGAPLEVVCADWGTVQLVGEREALSPVMGRILNRMKRFERWSLQAPRPDLRGAELGPEAAPGILSRQIAAASRSPFEQVATRALADAAGAARVEFDPVPQGISLDDPALPTALHVPWTYVTSGRRCVTREIIEGKARVRHERPCAAPCLRRLVLADYQLQVSPLVQKGNAVYMENPRFLKQVSAVMRQRGRWVVSPLL